VPELNDILQRLQDALGRCEGEPVPLTGGITNRNYRVRCGGQQYVVRLHGKDTGLLGIDRTAERLAGEEAARLGIAPPIAASVDGALVTRFVAAREPRPGELAQRVGELASALRAFHYSGVELPVDFDVPALLASYSDQLRAHGDELGRVGSEYREATRAAQRIADALPLARPRPCHNDLLPGNVLCAVDGRLMLVDWEYAGMGHPYFDLGNLSVNNELDEDAERALLAAYHGEPCSPARLAALRLARVLSDAREAAWGVLQSSISSLEFDFDGYAARHFERLRAAVHAPDFEDWLASAAT
jgi:thiamine kinase-like enzyme